MTPPPMDRPWQAGDDAVCIRMGVHTPGRWTNLLDEIEGDGPQLNGCYRVVEVFVPLTPFMELGMWLRFEAFPDEIYPSSCFRRLEPDNQAADDGVSLARIIRQFGEGARA